ncbi:hypothetical protein BKA56DRAFT_690927 [Ilyonectria sp. MPI-CAGE-AT-0026]|nr:hypothetical protein BKA56DRAFT_690927 [Ilyonectria sp. MPI-CAGE-AT-0026]
MQHLHLHIILYVFDALEVIFMHRLAMTLDHRLAKPISNRDSRNEAAGNYQARYPGLSILAMSNATYDQQIISLYGRRELNRDILTAVKIGERPVVSTALFGKLYERYESDIAGPTVEQLSFRDYPGH